MGDECGEKRRRLQPQQQDPLAYFDPSCHNMVLYGGQRQLSIEIPSQADRVFSSSSLCSSHRQRHANRFRKHRQHHHFQSTSLSPPIGRNHQPYEESLFLGSIDQENRQTNQNSPKSPVFNSELTCSAFPSCETGVRWKQGSRNSNLLVVPRNRSVSPTYHRRVISPPPATPESRHQKYSSNSSLLAPQVPVAVQEYQIGCCVKRRVIAKDNDMNIIPPITISPPNSVGFNSPQVSTFVFVSKWLLATIAFQLLWPLK